MASVQVASSATTEHRLDDPEAPSMFIHMRSGCVQELPLVSALAFDNNSVVALAGAIPVASFAREDVVFFSCCEDFQFCWTL